MIQVVNKAVRSKLVADAAVSALVGTRVYHMQAPATATLPYIIFVHAGGGSTNDSPRPMLDVVYMVKGVAGDGDTAEAVEAAIQGALDNATLTFDSPWKHMDCQHEAPFAFDENDDRRQYFHAGGNYRIRATQ